MRLMKMMDYDFKVANIWQYYVSEIIAYKLRIGYIRCFFIIVHHLHQTHHSSDRRITIQTMNHVYLLSVNLVQKMANDNLNSGHFGYTQISFSVNYCIYLLIKSNVNIQKLHIGVNLI